MWSLLQSIESKMVQAQTASTKKRSDLNKLAKTTLNSNGQMHKRPISRPETIPTESRAKNTKIRHGLLTQKQLKVEKHQY